MPQVVATLREQNSVIFHDNDFEVFVDAQASNHNYYEFEVYVYVCMYVCMYVVRMYV